MGRKGAGKGHEEEERSCMGRGKLEREGKGKRFERGSAKEERV